MATKIITKTGSGAPTTSEVSRGELAVDLTNKQLYTSNGTSVIKLGSGSGEGQWSLAPNGDDIYYKDGNVGAGVSDPQESLTVKSYNGRRVSIGAGTGSSSNYSEMRCHNDPDTGTGNMQYLANAHKFIVGQPGSGVEGLIITTDGSSTFGNNVSVQGTLGADQVYASGSNSDDWTASVRNAVPADYWSASESAFMLGPDGILGTQGSFGTDLTSNGYRNTDNQWTSLGRNGETGASQMSLLPTGDIFFKTSPDKPTGSNTVVPLVMVIKADGNVGVGVSSADIDEKFVIQGDMKLRGASGVWFTNTSDIMGLQAVNSNILQLQANTTAGELRFQTAGSTKMTISKDGNVGIGIDPTTGTFDLSAKEQLAEWKTKAKKASWEIVTDGEFSQEPTEELVEQWIETRAAGDKLQVAGDIAVAPNASAAGAAGVSVASRAYFGYDGSRNAAVISDNNNNKALVFDTTGVQRLKIDAGADIATFSGTVKALTFDGNVIRSSHLIQDGAPVVDSLQIIRAFMKLRDAVDDPDSSVEQLREKLKVAVVDIIDQFQDQIDNMDIPE